jgi:hypothetical protein
MARGCGQSSWTGNGGRHVSGSPAEKAQKTATPADMAMAAFEPEGISSRSADITLRTGGSGPVALDICLS